MKTKVIFYYPQHFNRANGENEYFNLLIEVCKRNRVNYLIVEEPDKSTQAPRNKLADKFDIFLLIILAMRKLIPLKWFSNFEVREQFIGKCLNLVSLGKFKASVYITLSNPLGGVFRGINKNARIFDCQHGIIPTSQPGYFQANCATERMVVNQKEVLVCGEGFRNSFLKVDPEYYSDKVFVIGKSNILPLKVDFGNHILVSLQIIESENMPEQWFSDQVDLLFEQFQKLEGSDLLAEKTIYLKHHPRSTQTYDIRKLLQFSFVELYDHSILHDFLLHITFFSTTAFDYAASGIPTLFLYSNHIPQGKTVYIEEFEYPYGNIFTIQEWLVTLSGSHQKEIIHQEILNWYKRFYSHFDETLFLKLIHEPKKN